MKNKYTALAAGIVTVLCTGILYLWSVFQPHVVEFYHWESAKAAQTSSILLTFFVIGNIVSGWLQHKIQARYIAIIGGLLFSSGLFLSSFVNADNSYLIYVTYGGISGLGCGFSYSLSLDMLQKHFKNRKGLITGLTVAMFGLSTVLLAPIIESLIDANGLVGAFRTLSLIFIVLLLPSAMFFFVPTEKESIVLKSSTQATPGQAIKTVRFWCIMFSLLFSSAGYVMLVLPYTKVLAAQRGLGDYSIYAVMAYGLGNAAGRIIFPAVSDKIGRENTMIILAFAAVGACLLMISATGPLFFIAVVIIAMGYGTAAGINPVLTSEMLGQKYFGANYGLVLAALPISSILFNKLSAIFGQTPTKPAFIIAAIGCALPIFFMFVLKRSVTKKKLEQAA